MRIAILGGSGFVGSHLLPELAAAGHHMTVLTRSLASSKSVALQPATRLLQADVYAQGELEAIFKSHDAVINLVGILNEKGFGGDGFRRAHVELTDTVIKAMRNSGCQRYLHMSALHAGGVDGSGDNPKLSHYLRTRGEAEQLVEQAQQQGLRTTIYQPSVIFGAGDSFINRFAGLLSLAPVLPLACPGSRFQPVWVQDVAAAFAGTLQDRDSDGQCYPLVGPDVYTLQEIVRYICSVKGYRRWIIPLPRPLSWLQGRLMDFVPGKPFSSDNYKSLQIDNVSDHNALPALGIEPRSMQAVVPDYLRPGARRQRISTFQRRAGRDHDA